MWSNITQSRRVAKPEVDKSGDKLAENRVAILAKALSRCVELSVSAGVVTTSAPNGAV